MTNDKSGLGGRMNDFGFEVVSKATDQRKNLAIDQKKTLKNLIQKSKEALSEQDYNTYWKHVFEIANTIKIPEDDHDAETDIIARIDRKLNELET